MKKEEEYVMVPIELHREYKEALETITENGCAMSVPTHYGHYYIFGDKNISEYFSSQRKALESYEKTYEKLNEKRVEMLWKLKRMSWWNLLKWKYSDGIMLDDKRSNP